MKRIPSSARLGAGLTIIAALIVLDTALWAYHVRAIGQVADGVSKSSEVVDTLEGVVSQIHKVEASQRLYLITGDERAQFALDQSLAEAFRRVDQVRGLTSDNPRQQARASDVRTRLVNTASVLTSTATARRNEGFEAARDLVISAAGLALPDQVESLIMLMQREERALLHLRREDVARTHEVAVLTGSMAAGATLLAVAIVGWLLTSHLTTRARAEASLDKQRRHLRATLASIGEGLITTDGNGSVTFMNAAAEALTGWTRSEAVGLPLDHVFVIVDQRSGQLVQNLALRALTMGSVGGLETACVLQSRGGEQYPVDDCAAPIRGSRGQVTGTVIVFRRSNPQRVETAGAAPERAVTVGETTPPALTTVPVLSEAARAPVGSSLAPDLSQTAARLRSARTVPEILAIVCDVARTVTGAHQALATYLPDAGWPQAITRISLGDRYAAWAALDVRLDGSGLEADVCETRRPLRLTAAEVDARNQAIADPDTAAYPPRRGWLGVPLLARDGGVVGILQVSDKDEGELTADDEMLLGIVAELGVSSIEQDRLRALLEQSELFRTELQANLERGQARDDDRPDSIAAWATPGTVDSLADAVWRPPAVQQASSLRAPRTQGRRYAILIVDPNPDEVADLALLLTVAGNKVRIARDGLEAITATAAFVPDLILIDLEQSQFDAQYFANTIRKLRWAQDVVLVGMGGGRKGGDLPQASAFDGGLPKPLNPIDLQAVLDGLQAPSLAAAGKTH